MSSTQITPNLVRNMAKLAKLSLNEQELKLYTDQFKSILNYIDKLDEIEANKTQPTYQTLDDTINIWREDKICPGLTQAQALSAAGKTHQGYFVADHVFDPNNKQENLQSPSSITRNKIDKLGAVLTRVDSKGRVGHKDLFCTEGIETTAGSKVLSGFIPPYSATIVKQLENLGYKTKYKLNQDAWGHGSSGENSDFFPTQNPYDTSKVPGGSSSGSGVVVAVGDVEVATGTDTCGSIRMPACYCNLTGLKPTYGALSRHGVIAFASSLDCPGLLARTTQKIEKIFSKITAPDKLDPTSQSVARKKISVKQIKTIGIPENFIKKGLNKSIEKLIYQAINTFKAQGFKIKNISLPHAAYGVAAYYVIALTETASNLARYDGIRFGKTRNFFGSEAKRRIMLGTFVSSAGYSDKYYEKAARVRSLIIKDFQKAFALVDAVFSPVSPTPPFGLGKKVSDPLKLYLMDIYAAPASLAGLPALALPCGFVKNLPVGFQLIGPRWSEPALLTLGKKYQQITNYHTQNP